MKKILLVLLTVLSGLTVMAAGKKIAVYVEGNVSTAEESIIYSSVIGRISGSKEYVSYERNTSFINALNKEHDYQISGEVSEKEIRSVGQRFGVDFVIVINAIIASENQCFMSARIVNLTSGEIIKSVNIKREYTGSEILSTMANNVAYRLINKQSK